MLSKKQFMILSCSDILQVFFRIFFIFTEQENVVRETVHDPLLPWPLSRFAGKSVAQASRPAAVYGRSIGQKDGKCGESGGFIVVWNLPESTGAV